MSRGRIHSICGLREIAHRKFGSSVTNLEFLDIPRRRGHAGESQPADRIHFSTGRDLVLSPASEAMPLNYLIYPYVEVGGKPWRVKLQKRFAFEDQVITDSTR